MEFCLGLPVLISDLAPTFLQNIVLGCVDPSLGAELRNKDKDSISVVWFRPKFLSNAKVIACRGDNAVPYRANSRPLFAKLEL